MKLTFALRGGGEGGEGGAFRKELLIMLLLKGVEHQFFRFFFALLLCQLFNHGSPYQRTPFKNFHGTYQRSKGSMI